MGNQSGISNAIELGQNGPKSNGKSPTWGCDAMKSARRSSSRNDLQTNPYRNSISEVKMNTKVDDDFENIFGPKSPFLKSQRA